MCKKIGFVLNAPIRYSETFLLKEISLLNEKFEVILLEGYSKDKVDYSFKRKKSLPLKIKDIEDIKNVLITISSLLTFGFIPLIKFIVYEIMSGTGPIRILKKIWFNSHILSSKVSFLHFCFAEVTIQKERVAKAINAKMSVSLRGSDILVYPNENKNCYINLWKYADKIHVVSEYIFKEALKLGLSKDKNYQIIYDGVLPEMISFNSNDLQSPIQILNVGRLETVKDQYFSLQVVKYLIERNIQVEFKIIGEGSKRDFLIQKINELNLNRYVQLLGKKTNNEVLSAMSNSDIYIQTSTSEGLCVSILEAQASGLLTFSLDSGGTIESIEDEKSGWIVKERNPSAMSAKIIEIINKPFSERMRIKKYSRNRIERQFNFNMIRKNWEDFFEN